MSILDKVLRIGEGRVLKKLHSVAEQVNRLEPSFVELSDTELREETARFRERLEHGATLDELMPEAFAATSPRCAPVRARRWWPPRPPTSTP